MATLRHEESFKEQVNELHRLYRIQKFLMKNIASNRPPNGRSQQLWNSKSQIKLDLEQPADESYGDSDIIDETQMELTLGPPSRQLTSDSGPSFSSSSTGSSCMNRGSSLTAPKTNGESSAGE